VKLASDDCAQKWQHDMDEGGNGVSSRAGATSDEVQDAARRRNGCYFLKMIDEIKKIDDLKE
jgi:hypothetical protein